MKTLLIVEDDRDLRTLLVEYFSGGDFEVLSAGDGLDALKCFETQKIDFALIDLHMPRMGGADLLKVIRAKPEAQPKIYLMSGGVSAEERINFQGADGFFEKPLEIELVLEELKKLK